MNERWTTLPNAPRVLQHAASAHPAWLWSPDGQRLLWSNAAAGLFHARLKKHGVKRLDPAVPIKGQVARILRLGSAGRSSLARIQFLAGEKPISATCNTTPLPWDGGELALLIVAVDPVPAEIMQAADLDATEVPAWQPDVSPETEAADAAAQDGVLEDWHEPEPEPMAEPVPAPVIEDHPAEWQAALADNEAEIAAEPEPSRRLTDLVSRLAADDGLFTPLGESDDRPPETALPAEPVADAPEADAEPETVPQLYKIVGRGFVAARADDLATTETVESPAIADTEPPADIVAAGDKPEVDVERVSRYNFDELSRILTDRVGDRNGKADHPAPVAVEPVAPPAGGSLISLGGETLVLNRLPLGILVFRDQQILFANRAITEMVGYDSVESLRHAGLGAVFPAVGEGGQEAGPVNHLVQQDGTLVPVTARLQSTSWQGRPALMLSASATEVRTGHEEAVRAFAQNFAELRGDGFIEFTRSGMVSQANATASALLLGGQPLAGRSLAGLVGNDDAVALRGFLERPARFAETTRPCLLLRSADGKSDVMLFALGQAGVISGYFGFVQVRDVAPPKLLAPADADPALLARISRGVRRPLNTVIGFSDLIRSQAFGMIGNERYEEYADDIARAGKEIAALVDELDDYARLRDGRYMAQRASLDLTSLLESCVLRIRDQANAGRVIVRNAISESLPKVTADRASLAQAVLNLLASAIDQTPTGGAVVISAQRLDDGAIAIHVRDSSTHSVDMAERFVVFRDGVDRNGQMLAPIRSSVGLALTRSLLAVNAVSLSVDPAGPEGMLFTLKIPADLVDDPSGSA